MMWQGPNRGDRLARKLLWIKENSMVIAVHK
jgi:hypothetical protein